MIRILLAIALLCAPSIALAKTKEVPLPRPSPVRLAALHVVQAVNPDPFKVQPQPTTTTPITTTQPVTVVTAPQSDGILSWVWAALGAIITGLLGKIAFKPPALPSSTPAIDASHPDIRALIDQVLLRAIQTGLPGQAIQTGASLIPGIGGLAGALEPMLRKIVTEALEKKIGGGETAHIPASPVSGLPQDFFQQIEDRILAKLKGA